MKNIFQAVIGLMIIQHGISKLVSFSQTEAFFSSLDLPVIVLIGTITIELAGGLALVLGLFVPYASLLIIATLAGALIKVHLSEGYAGMELVLLYIVCLAYFVVTNRFNKVWSWKKSGDSYQ
ncbi:DoxX family protein [Listeria sp. PSOL-1]|uniref:DoxX family protein n=1 Tax=Listeria sp. PSOL-1 TaxID=1844999 RepID=UPI0013D5381A|nr:DoxX family protein [Listeria sp. PSOL-1]